MVHYDKPAIVKLSGVVNLGEAKQLVLKSRFKREWFRPNRILMNIPGPDMFHVNEVECGDNGRNQLVGPIDGFQLAPIFGRLSMVFPAAESPSKVGVVVDYIGGFPRGYVLGAQFDLRVIMAEPGVGLHLGNYDDITLEDN